MWSKSVGGEMLERKYNYSPLAVAEAFILGELNSVEQNYVSELVDEVTLQTARIRLETMGLLNKDHIKPTYEPKRTP